VDVAAAAMTASAALAPVRQLLEDGVGRAYPGAVLSVLFRGDVVLRCAVGLAARTPVPRPALPTTIYDLASLTKVVATTPLILQAAAEGRLTLDDPLPRHLSESPHASITVRHLLAHTSGLPAWIPFYLESRGRNEILARAATTPLVAAPGAQVLYSDLGFMLLGEIAHRTLGAPLDRLASVRVTEPLGMTDTRYLPPADVRDRIAPTEDGTAIEQAMAGAAGVRHTWRKTLIWGEVHDSNAHAMGGVSGHAGLFGTADDLVAYARLWLGADPRRAVLTPALMREALSPMPPDGSRGLGWALAGPHAWWGDALSPRAYGHTGFPGTAIAVDPERALAIVLLTNAVHLGRERTEILALRPMLASAVARALAP
jgi:CubicO group peptidase (beta-lactamase class C family)